jgi:radical SAM protein
MSLTTGVPRGAGRSFDDRPLLVLWETTKACELACHHCRANAQPGPGADDLTTGEAIAMLDGLAALGSPRPICILTGGDCLSRSDLYDITSHAAAACVPVAVAPSVTSKLNRTAMRELASLGVRTASLSLDGASPSTHDTLRGVEGHFDVTLRRIRELKECGFKVQVNTTVMESNLDELSDVAVLLHDLGVDVWEVFFLISTGRGIDVAGTTAAQNEDVCHFLVDASQYGMLVRTVEAPFFRRVVHERREAGAAIQVERTFDLGDLYVALRDRLRFKLGPPRIPVRAPSAATRDGKGIVFVAANGDVYPSGFMPLRVGSVRERQLVDIYRDDPVLRSIRSAAFPGVCGACEYADLCGGSRARAYATSGDPLGDDPGCLRVLVGSA